MGQPLSISPSLSGVWESTQPRPGTELHCFPQTKDRIAHFLIHRGQVGPTCWSQSLEYFQGFHKQTSPSSLFRLPHSTGGSWAALRREYFLVDQIACGNPPVQFVGTKVAFVTQITVFYQLGWGPGRW